MTTKTMNKNVLIPAILAATVLIAGIFALMPVDKAQTVHSTILSTGVVQAVANTKSQVNAAATTYTWTSTAPIRIVGFKVVEGASAAHTTSVITIATMDGAAIATAAVTATTPSSAGAAVTYFISESNMAYHSTVAGGLVVGAGFSLPLHTATSFSITKVNTLQATTTTDTVTLIVQTGGTVTAS